MVNIELPPLRERLADIPLLAEHFLGQNVAETGRQDDAGLHPGGHRRTMQRYHWPGNVRELENVVERAVVLCRRARPMSCRDRPAPGPRRWPHRRQNAKSRPGPSSPDPHREGPRRPRKADHRAGPQGQQLEPPDHRRGQLEINRTTLYKKMKRYGLEFDPSMQTARDGK